MNNQMIANRYVLVQLIGEGGMATVYLAVDTVMKKEVAIKILRGELAKDPVSLLRFQREASATTKLSHPNVVEVYDVGEDDGKNFIVMEYVKGRTLKDLVAQRGALSKEEATNIMKQLVSAVAVAHKNGIVHRDIKSQNVLIKDDGTVKLSDFGIALANDTVQLTQTDVVMGSVHYMAPELARGENATVQSDIYSLGIVFYEMMTGDVPYHAEAPVQVALKHMREEIPSVRDFNPSLPQSIENIITRSTAKQKENRYEAADEMYEDLITCLDVKRAKEPKLTFAKPQATTQRLDAEEEKGSIGKKVRGTMFYLLMIVAVIVLIGTIIGGVLLLNGGSLGFIGGKIVPVPDVTGLSITEATAILQEEGFNVSTVYQYEVTDDLDKNLIYRTDPEPFTEIKQGTTINFILSEGKYYIMEDFTKSSLEDVEQALSDYNIKLDVTYVDSTKYEEGTVLSQDIQEGTKVHPTRLTYLKLEVTQFPEIYISLTYQNANIDTVKAELEKAGAVVKKKKLDVPTVKNDKTITVCIEHEKDPDTGEELEGCLLEGEKTISEDVDDPKYDNLRNVVIKCSVDFGKYYKQTNDEKCYIILYYYPGKQ